MPKGIPKVGFRKTKRWKAKSVQDIEKSLADKLPDIIAKLESLTEPIKCPNCGFLIPVIDKDVCMYLIDRVMGKPKQKHEVDVAETIQLTADQIDTIIENHVDVLIDGIIAQHLDKVVARHQLAIRALLPQGEVIEGEWRQSEG